MIQAIACFLTFLCCVLSAAEEQWMVSSRGMNVPFHSGQAEGVAAGLAGIGCFNRLDR
jgi:hypothetical protein